MPLLQGQPSSPRAKCTTAETTRETGREGHTAPRSSPEGTDLPPRRVLVCPPPGHRPLARVPPPNHSSPPGHGPHLRPQFPKATGPKGNSPPRPWSPSDHRTPQATVTPDHRTPRPRYPQTTGPPDHSPPRSDTSSPSSTFWRREWAAPQEASEKLCRARSPPHTAKPGWSGFPRCSRPQPLPVRKAPLKQHQGARTCRPQAEGLNRPHPRPLPASPRRRGGCQLPASSSEPAVVQGLLSIQGSCGGRERGGPRARREGRVREERTQSSRPGSPGLRSPKAAQAHGAPQHAAPTQGAGTRVGLGSRAPRP